MTTTASTGSTGRAVRPRAETDAYRDITVYRAIAQHTHLCAWSIAHPDGDHEWCPTVIEPGDEHIAVTDTTATYRYCLGCGHHLYGLATLDPIRQPAA